MTTSASLPALRSRSYSSGATTAHPRGRRRRRRDGGEGSRWGPWLNMLPGAGNTPGSLDLPLFWPKTDAAYLEGCSTRPIAELANEADEDFDWLEKNVFAANRATFPEDSFGRDQWRLALGLALSRSFFLGGATRLVPFLDFANHDDDLRVEPSSSWGGAAEQLGGGGGGAGANMFGRVVGGALS